MGTTKDIHKAVEAELKFDPLVEDADVHVVNVNGEVALDGTVPSYPQYLQAATAAQRVAGVQIVHNHLAVKLPAVLHHAGQRQAAELAVAGLTGVRNVKDEIVINFAADPGDVTVLVQDALNRNALVADDSDVKVGTDGNTVTLTGHVRSWAEHDAVVGAAWMASGVSDVRDDLDITG